MPRAELFTYPSFVLDKGSIEAGNKPAISNRRFRAPHSAAVWMLAALLYLLLLISPSSAQQLMPFLGRGDTPPSSPVDVHVSAYLDRILKVDDKDYTFQVGVVQRYMAMCYTVAAAEQQWTAQCSIADGIADGSRGSVTVFSGPKKHAKARKKL